MATATVTGDVEDHAPTGSERPTRGRRPDGRVITIAILIVLVPLVVSAIAAWLDPPISPISDFALTEMRVRDIGSHPVVLGLYSRDGWSHPGPLLFYSLVVPYRLLGSRPVGLEIGALLVNGVALAGLGVVARRIGGFRAALALLLGASVLMRALGADLIRDPWVCSVTTLPFALFLALLWALVDGRVRALPFAAFVGSWLVQTHIGFAAIVAPLLMLAALTLVVRVRQRGEGWAPLLRFSGLTAVVLLVVWALPLWDQVWGRGNMREIVSWFSNSGEPPATLLEGVRVVLGQFAVNSDWITGHRPIEVVTGGTLLRTEWRIPVLVALFGGAVVLAWVRRSRAAVALGAVLITTVVVGVVAVGRTVGIMYEYRLLWTWTIGAMAAGYVVWVAWAWSAARWPGSDRVVRSIVLLALAGLAVVQIVDVTGPPNRPWSSPETRSVGAQLARTYQPEDGPLLLRWDTINGGWFLQGLVVELERRGFDVRVPEGDDGGVFGDHRIADGTDPQADLTVVAAVDIAGLQGRPEDLVAYAGPRPLFAQERFLRRFNRDSERLIAERQEGRITQAEFERRFRALQAGRGAVAVLRTTAPPG